MSQLIFFSGFVQTAGYCHFCDEIGELADASAQYRVDIKGDLIFQHWQFVLTQHIHATNNSGVFHRYLNHLQISKVALYHTVIPILRSPFFCCLAFNRT